MGACLSAQKAFGKMNNPNFPFDKKDNKEANTEYVAKILKGKKPFPFDNEQVLNLCVIENDVDLVRKLLEYGVPQDGTMLTIAMHKGNKELSDLLIQYGADPNQKITNLTGLKIGGQEIDLNKTPLDIAVDNKDVDSFMQNTKTEPIKNNKLTNFFNFCDKLKKHEISEKQISQVVEENGDYINFLRSVLKECKNDKHSNDDSYIVKQMLEYGPQLDMLHEKQEIKIVFYLKETVYDNPLMNEKELFAELSDVMGMNNVLNTSQNLIDNGNVHLLNDLVAMGNTDMDLWQDILS
tara:strand:- start:197 stop:1078 length:882 start_codon:yes stop_codon:yes gene_type:complete